MQVGIVVPTFQDDPDVAIRTALAAEAGGLDGAFVYDHLWPMGQPERPALHGTTMLGAIAAETSSIAVGTLVARVSLVPEAVLANAFATIARIAGPRVIAALGTGDHLSKAENEAYGVRFPSVAERLDALASACRRMRADGMPVWVGGRSSMVRDIAAREADGLNLWGVGAAELVDAADALIREVGGRDFDLTWGGQVRFGTDERPEVIAGDPAEITGALRALGEAGASWVICAVLGDDAVEGAKRLSEVAGGLR